MQLWLNEVIRVGPHSNVTSIPIRRLKDTTETGMHREKDMWGYRGKTAICKPRTKASVEHWWHFDFGLPASSSLMKINFSFLSYPVCGIFVTVAIEELWIWRNAHILSVQFDRCLHIYKLMKSLRIKKWNISSTPGSSLMPLLTHFSNCDGIFRSICLQRGFTQAYPLLRGRVPPLQVPPTPASARVSQFRQSGFAGLLTQDQKPHSSSCFTNDKYDVIICIWSLCLFLSCFRTGEGISSLKPKAKPKFGILKNTLLFWLWNVSNIQKYTY